VYSSDKLRLITLLQYLEKKDILSPMEVVKVVTTTDLINLLVSKGIINREEVEKSQDDLVEFVKFVGTVCLHGIPKSLQVAAQIQEFRERLGPMVDVVLKELK
jgi:hypothetical protein